MNAHPVLKRIGFTLILSFAVGMVVCFFLFLNARPAPNHAWFFPRPGDHKPLVIAHQGGEGEYPGNTMPAFENASRAGADVLDTDMHITKDGVFVLIHDATVDRTTNGKGAIRDLMLSEIKQLDAAYSFTTDNGATFPYRGRGVTVPTLEELFDAFPDKRLGIEIKPTEPSDISRRFCALIRKHELQKNVLVSSFRQEIMDTFRSECPEVATSATVNEVLVFLKLNALHLTRALAPNYSCLQVPEKSGAVVVITPESIAAARERNLPILEWTINEEPALQRAIAWGAEGINTDYPTRLLRILRNR